jgi:hypothetical protein
MPYFEVGGKKVPGSEHDHNDGSEHARLELLAGARNFETLADRSQLREIRDSKGGPCEGSAVAAARTHLAARSAQPPLQSGEDF